MKKLIYIIILTVVSCGLFSCQEEVVSPIDQGAEVEIVPTQENTEGGNDPDTDQGTKN